MLILEIILTAIYCYRLNKVGKKWYAGFLPLVLTGVAGFLMGVLGFDLATTLLTDVGCVIALIVLCLKP